MNHEGAVREVAQVYERIKIQQPLLLHYSLQKQPPSSTTTTQLAHDLLSEALRALNVALSVMKQQQQPALDGGPATPSVKAEPQLSPPSPASADSGAITTSTPRRRGKRIRSSVMEGKTSSWVCLTTVPYEDGYEWRKYGEKKINGTSYTRNYFRCTYNDGTGCLATKHVQQRDNSDPPMFQVTYNNEHTCNKNNCTATTTAASNSSEGVMAINHQPNAMNIKQEPLPVMPPLVEASSALPFDQQEESSFPISMQQFMGTATDCRVDANAIPSAASSCISGDEYSAGGGMAAQMAAAGASAGYDLRLYDLELFLLDDSF